MQGRIPGLQQTHAGADKVDWGLHGMLESLANNHISAKIRLQHKNGSMQGHIPVCHDTLCSVMLARISQVQQTDTVNPFIDQLCKRI